MIWRDSPAPKSGQLAAPKKLCRIFFCFKGKFYLTGLFTYEQFQKGWSLNVEVIEAFLQQFLVPCEGELRGHLQRKEHIELELLSTRRPFAASCMILIFHI